MFLKRGFNIKIASIFDFLCALIFNCLTSYSQRVVVIARLIYIIQSLCLEVIFSQIYGDIEKRGECKGKSRNKIFAINL